MEKLIGIFGRKNPRYLFSASIDLIQLPVYDVVHDVLTHTLIHLRDVEKNLKYWQSVYDKRPSSEFLLTVTHLYKLRRSLSTFLSKVYAESDKFIEPAYLQWDSSRLLNLYIRNVNSHFLELEDSVQELCTATESSSLSFEKLGDEDEDPPESFFRDAVDLLSSNLNKLDDCISFLVVKYRKPSKTSRRWIYYTVGAIGVSVFSLWLLRDGRLSGVVQNWALEAKESVTGLFIDQDKSLTLVNRRRHKELKQVQSTRDFSFAKELQNLSREDSARPRLNQIQKFKLGVEMVRELFELNHEVLMASDRLLATLAAIPVIILSVSGLVLSHALVKQVLGKGGRSARAQARLLVKEVEERFKEYQKQCLPSDRHYNHGLILCTLDRLHRAVESSAKKNGEWQSLREELIALGKLNYSDADKLMVISHFKGAYVCLFPFRSSGPW